MATLVIRDVESELHVRLKASAIANSRSMEEEVRVLLRNSFLEPTPKTLQPFGQAMQALFAPLNAADLAIPVREKEGSSIIPDFSGPDFSELDLA